MQQAGEFLSDNTLIAGVAAFSGTQYIIELAEDPQARAERIIGYVDLALAMVDSDEQVTLPQLKQAVLDAILWESIPPADQGEVRDLVDEIERRIAAEIEERAVLSPEAEMGLEHILRRVRMAAEQYA